jgi:hypothetical protein
MTTNDLEQSLRTRIQILADTLPVDHAKAWNQIAGRADPLSVRPHRLRRRDPGPRRTRLAVIAAAGTAALAAGTVGVVVLGATTASGAPALPIPLPFGHGTNQQAVATLTSAAEAQRHLGSGSGSGSGTVLYAKTQNYALQTNVGRHKATTTVETTVRQVWVSPDGASVEKSWTQDTTRSGATIGAPGATSTDTHWQDINANFPTTPTSATSTLLGNNDSTDDRDWTIAQGVMSHLSVGTASTAQIANLYQILAGLPGVFDAGTLTDSAGRTGHAVGIQTGVFDAAPTCLTVSGPSSQVATALAQQHALGQGITYLVLDPTTGQPLEIEQIDTPNAPCGLRLPPQPTIEEYNVILRAGQVATPGSPAP